MNSAYFSKYFGKHCHAEKCGSLKNEAHETPCGSLQGTYNLCSAANLSHSQRLNKGESAVRLYALHTSASDARSLNGSAARTAWTNGASSSGMVPRTFPIVTSTARVAAKCTRETARLEPLGVRTRFRLEPYT